MAIGVMMTNLLFDLLLAMRGRCTQLKIRVNIPFFISCSCQTRWVRASVPAWAQTLSRPLDSANSEMFISKAACAAQAVLRRMSHPQATCAPSEVGSGPAPGGERAGAEERC